MPLAGIDFRKVGRAVKLIDLTASEPIDADALAGGLLLLRSRIYVHRDAAAGHD